MDHENLIVAIKEGFAQGKRKEQIKKELLEKGWTAADIDAGIYHIQRMALKQIPGFSHFFTWYDDPQVKEKLATPKMTAAILVGCVTLLLLIGVGFYFLFDPFGIRAINRDKQREADLTLMRDGITTYYTTHAAYPPSLDALQPNIVKTLPTDPSTGDEYAYTMEDSGRNYQLCINFEAENPVCIYATPIKPIVPGPATGAAKH